jgi:hypothetical protein
VSIPLLSIHHNRAEYPTFSSLFHLALCQQHDSLYAVYAADNQAELAWPWSAGLSARLRVCAMSLSDLEHRFACLDLSDLHKDLYAKWSEPSSTFCLFTYSSTAPLIYEIVSVSFVPPRPNLDQTDLPSPWQRVGCDATNTYPCGSRKSVSSRYIQEMRICRCAASFSNPKILQFSTKLFRTHEENPL